MQRPQAHSHPSLYTRGIPRCGSILYVQCGAQDFETPRRPWETWFRGPRSFRSACAGKEQAE